MVNHISNDLGILYPVNLCEKGSSHPNFLISPHHFNKNIWPKTTLNDGAFLVVTVGNEKDSIGEITAKNFLVPPYVAGSHYSVTVNGAETGISFDYCLETVLREDVVAVLRKKKLSGLNR